MQNSKLLGDPVRLRQVLLNLLSNAVKFTDTGIVKVSAAIIHSSESTCAIHFEITDTGIGMEPEQMRRIFEPFVQADSGVTRKYGGTGRVSCLFRYHQMKKTGHYGFQSPKA